MTHCDTRREKEWNADLLEQSLEEFGQAHNESVNPCESTG
jgi:hypothetical protein